MRIDMFGNPIADGDNSSGGSVYDSTSGYLSPNATIPGNPKGVFKSPYDAAFDQMKSQFDNEKYTQMYDPATMAVTPGMQSRLDAIQPDTSGLDAYKQEALRNGPSKWAQDLTQSQRIGEQTDINAMQRGAAGNVAEATANQARGSGLSTGAAERTGQNIYRDAMNSEQGLRSSGQQQRLGIGAQDEQNQLAMKQALPGMQLAALQPQFQKASLWGNAMSGDVQNQMASLGGKDAFDLQKFHDMYGAWGNSQAAKGAAAANS